MANTKTHIGLYLAVDRAISRANEPKEVLDLARAVVGLGADDLAVKLLPKIADLSTLDGPADSIARLVDAYVLIRPFEPPDEEVEI